MNRHAPAASRTAAGRDGGPHLPSPVGPAWSRWVGRFLAKVVWATRVVGAEHVPPRGPVLIAANHTGVVDGPLVLGVAPRPLHVLVKEELFTGPVGWILRLAGQIPVDRTGGRAALATARAVLGRGGAVGVFPEGGRGRGDASVARGGVAWLALNGAPGSPKTVPVVPVAVLGTRRTGEGVNHIPGLRRRLYVEFGAPLTIARPPGVSGRRAQMAAGEQIRAALADLVAGAEHRSGIELPADDPHRGH